MSKAIKNMIIYTIIIATITTGINFIVMNKIYNDKINKVQNELEQVKNDNENDLDEQTLHYLTTQCSFEKDGIVCD